MKEITYEDLQKENKDSYIFVDVRDEGLREYGMIPGAVAVYIDAGQGDIAALLAKIPPEKKLILYCQIGRKSQEIDPDEIPGLAKNPRS